MPYKALTRFEEKQIPQSPNSKEVFHFSWHLALHKQINKSEVLLKQRINTLCFYSFNILYSSQCQQPKPGSKYYTFLLPLNAHKLNFSGEFE